jgi:hypothetical protein
MLEFRDVVRKADQELGTSLRPTAREPPQIGNVVVERRHEHRDGRAAHTHIQAVLKQAQRLGCYVFRNLSDI